MSTARPILFSAPMVRALRDGRKSQTRRMVNLPPTSEHPWRFKRMEGAYAIFSRANRMVMGYEVVTRFVEASCPYGKRGDLLYVREDHYRFGHWEPVPGVRTKTGRTKWRFVADRDDVLYEPPAQFRKGRHHKDPATRAWHKRLARFMPRRFSRLTLRITDVRVERLQSISEEDAKAEGVRRHDWQYENGEGPETYRDAYACLWDHINGEGSWDQNPWCWCIQFECIRKNVDEVLRAEGRGGE